MEKKERERERAGYYCLRLKTSDLIPGLFLDFCFSVNFRFSPHQVPTESLQFPSPEKEHE